MGGRASSTRSSAGRRRAARGPDGVPGARLRAGAGAVRRRAAPPDEARERTVSTTRRFVRRQRSWFRRDAATHLVRRGRRRPARRRRRADHRPYDRAVSDCVPGCSSGTAPRTTSWCCPTPTAPSGRRTGSTPRWCAGCATAARAWAATASSASSAARTCPTRPPCSGSDLDRCEWFMDHRNADGSHAEMCGNGIRLFLHVLVTEGLLDRAACEAGVLVGTRGGPRRVGATRRRRLLGRHGPGPAVRRRRGRPVRAGRSPGWRCRWATRTWPASPTSTSTALDLTAAPDVRRGALPRRRQRRGRSTCSSPARTSGCGCSSAAWGRPAPAAPGPAPPPTRRSWPSGRDRGDRASSTSPGAGCRCRSAPGRRCSPARP